MEIKIFLIEFEKALISHGLTREAARHHTIKVAKSLSDNDKKRIGAFNSLGQVGELATNYVNRIKMSTESPTEKIDRDTSADTAAISNNFTKTINEGEGADELEEVKVYPRIDKEFKSNEASAKTMTFTSVKTDRNISTDTANFKTTQIKAIKNETTAENDDDVNVHTKRISKVDTRSITLSKEGKKEFNKKIAARSPLFVLGFLGSGIGALAVYSVIAALIVFFILLLVAVIITGGVGTLAGLIYGLIKIFSVLPEGLYEIGFALVIAGITLALSICSYNVAVRAIPVLWKKFDEFLSRCFKKFKAYINEIRKECADI